MMKIFKLYTIFSLSTIFFYLIVLEIIPWFIFDRKFSFFNKENAEMQTLINKRDSIQKEYDLFNEKQTIKDDIELMERIMGKERIKGPIQEEIEQISDRIKIKIKKDTIVVFKNIEQ